MMMTNRILKSGRNLVVGLQVAGVATGAQAADYTRCLVPSQTYASKASDYCIPATSADVPAPGRTFTVVAAPGQEGQPVVLALPARNCRAATNRYNADVVLVLDSSQSLEKTDPQDERMSGTDSFVGALRNKDANLSLGVVSYGGRLRFLASNPEDPTGPAYTATVVDAAGNPIEAPSPKYLDDDACADGDDAADLQRLFSNNDQRTGFSGLFESQDAVNRWSERASDTDTNPLSMCEFLRLVASTVDASGNATQPGMSRQSRFLRLPEGNPRGATDVGYMLSTATRPTVLGASSKRAKHVVLITDGLPNVPKRRPESYCRAKDYLPKNEFETDPLSPTPDEPFCIDRNFREGVESAHTVALSANYRSVNLHNVLYWSTPDESFIDFDDQGTLNPADFLIENSARTGNGKVKFRAAVGGDNLARVLQDLLPQFDEASLQRVDITVTDGTGRARPTYSAVSPSGFPADPNNPQDKRFDLKVLYLTNGNNSVRVDYMYGDRTVTETLTVNVSGGGAPSGDVICAEASSSFTIDGDRKDYPVCLARDPRDKVPAPPPECTGSGSPASCECREPQGDGFLPFPDADGNIRVYRNADAANKEFEEQEQFARVRDFGAGKGPVKASDLRIQGGTGNCGVVAGLSPEQLTAARPMTLMLLLAPLLLAAFAALGSVWSARRRRLR
jgi:hypothetical protein